MKEFVFRKDAIGVEINLKRDFGLTLSTFNMGVPEFEVVKAYIPGVGDVDITDKFYQNPILQNVQSVATLGMIRSQMINTPLLNVRKFEDIDSDLKRILHGRVIYFYRKETHEHIFDDSSPSDWYKGRVSYASNISPVKLDVSLTIDTEPYPYHLIDGVFVKSEVL